MFISSDFKAPTSRTIILFPQSPAGTESSVKHDRNSCQAKVVKPAKDRPSWKNRGKHCFPANSRNPRDFPLKSTEIYPIPAQNKTLTQTLPTVHRTVTVADRVKWSMRSDRLALAPCYTSNKMRHLQRTLTDTLNLRPFNPSHHTPAGCSLQYWLPWMEQAGHALTSSCRRRYHTQMP